MKIRLLTVDNNDCCVYSALDKRTTTKKKNTSAVFPIVLNFMRFQGRADSSCSNTNLVCLMSWNCLVQKSLMGNK